MNDKPRRLRRIEILKNVVRGESSRAKRKAPTQSVKLRLRPEGRGRGPSDDTGVGPDLDKAALVPRARAGMQRGSARASGSPDGQNLDNKMRQGEGSHVAFTEQLSVYRYCGSAAEFFAFCKGKKVPARVPTQPHLRIKSRSKGGS